MMEWIEHSQAPALLGAVAFLVAQVTALIVGWVRMKDQTNEAKEEAAEAKKIALEAHEKLNVAQAGFAVYRERIASEYVHRDTMREVEGRVVDAARQTEARLSEQIQHLGDRIDKAFANSAHR